MKNNVSAKKLSFYFAIVLVVFSLIIGFIFFTLYKKQTIEIQEKLLIERAETIAKDIEKFDTENSQKEGYGNYLRSIKSIVGTDAWIVDENLNITTSHSKMHKKMHGNSNSNNNSKGMKKWGNMMNSSKENEENSICKIDSQEIELPANAEKVINEVLSGEVEVNNAFSDILGEDTITVGVPVETNSETGKEAVLLHSPITGIEEAVKQGVKALIISLIIGLILSILLSIFLSKIFTGPILLEEAEKIIEMEDNRKNFLAQVAHELKTPITVMKSTVENFEIKENPTVEELKENNEIVLDEVNSLQRLVGDLLDLSKLEAPDFSMEISDIAMQDLINDVVRSCRKIAKNKNIEVIQENIPQIIFKGDYVRLRQMLLIVLDNGIKFSNENSKIFIKGNKNSIEISDSGIGMSKEELNNIYKKFYKSNLKVNENGTGLGLSIAKEIAKKHNIEIKVNSEINKGTIFYFKFKNIKNI